MKKKDQNIYLNAWCKERNLVKSLTHQGAILTLVYLRYIKIEHNTCANIITRKNILSCLNS